MKLTGAQILMEVLKEEGVDTIFGYPGGAIIDIYDELAKTEINDILVRHEQAAVHAADGYARASGRVGVCLVTSGPGVTNTVTGIASAYMDSVPMVILSGQVPTALIGNDAFQEVDMWIDSKFSASMRYHGKLSVSRSLATAARTTSSTNMGFS